MTDIGAKISLDGEKQFKSELAQITQEGKTLSAQMDQLTTSFKNEGKAEKDSTELSKKLSQQIENQQKLVDKLKEAVARSTEKTGENSTQTLKWKEKLAKAEKGLSDLEKQSRDAASGVDKLGDEEKETSEQTSVFGDVLKANLASQAIISGVKALAGVVKDVAKFFVEAVKGAAEYADEVKTLASVTGMSTDAIQEYKYAADLLDVDFSTIQGSLTKLTSKMSSAKDGNKAATEAFEKLGISVLDADGNLRDANEVFDEAITALGKIPNETERDAAAMDIFGKSAKELNPLIEAGADALAGFREEAHKVGAVMDKDTLDSMGELQDTVDRFKGTWEALKRTLGAKIGIKALPELEKLFKAFQDFVKTGDISPLVDHVVRAFKNLSKKLIQGAPKFAKEFGKALGTVIGNLPELIAAGFELGGALLDGLVKAIPDMGRAIAKAFNKSMLSDGTRDAIAEIEKLSASLKEIPGRYERMASSLGDVNAKQREAEHWIAIFDELSQKTAPTADETAKLQTAVEKLNELYPELGLQIDDETGKWNMNTQEIRKNIDALSDRYKAEAYYAAASDTLKQIAAIEAETRALRQQNQALGNAIANREAVNRTLKDEYDALLALELQRVSGTLSTKEYTDALKALGYESRELAYARMDELTKAIGNNNKALRDMRAEYEAGSATLAEADAKIAQLNSDVEWLFNQGATWESKAYAVGKNLPAGIVKGINDGTASVEKAAGSLMNSAINRMRAVAQIKSPSKVTENLIGKNLALGVIKGWDDVFGSSRIRSAFSLSGAIGAMTTNNTTNLGGVSIIVNSAPGQDTNAVAEAVMRKMQASVDARRAVFA